MMGHVQIKVAAFNLDTSDIQWLIDVIHHGGVAAGNEIFSNDSNEGVPNYKLTYARAHFYALIDNWLISAEPIEGAPKNLRRAYAKADSLSAINLFLSHIASNPELQKRALTKKFNALYESDGHYEGRPREEFVSGLLQESAHDAAAIEKIKNALMRSEWTTKNAHINNIDF